ncbi:sugar transferase [Clostridium gasigenes]|uniref:sugar transferase n=1 Tax=Clostridium gasigenes TaxID=94869 RepID=UPI001629E4E5|nr:sugar transferase [Clostridium gasigenes]MBB6624658.1 sugar transferase [Clostridium gasigenes]MBU3137166.1 sugar transferase [Clostridium gasigenes]
MKLKRFLDFSSALIALILLSPVLIIVGILVRLNLGSPIFFIQERVGKNNEIFKMMKFRTMKDAKDKNGNQLPDYKRLTKFGKMLRSLSIDELPELINILKGDMSLVGPRPLLVEYLPLYNEEQIKRHDMLPGLTGLAQVSGRNALTWSEKFRLDVWYVKNWTLRLDIKIFFKTIGTVIKKEGINHDDKVTMEYFNGSN